MYYNVISRLSLDTIHSLSLLQMEVNGNIRVHIRIRPVLEQDRLADDVIESVNATSPCEIETHSINYPENILHFEYDKVYGLNSPLSEVCSETTQMVTSLADGLVQYNIIIRVHILHNSSRMESAIIFSSHIHKYMDCNHLVVSIYLSH